MGRGSDDILLAEEFIGGSAYADFTDVLQAVFDEISKNLSDMLVYVAYYSALEDNPCVYADRYIEKASDSMYMASNIELPQYIAPSSYVYARLMLCCSICHDSTSFYDALKRKSNEAIADGIECDERHLRLDPSMLDIADERIASTVEAVAEYLADNYGKVERSGCYDVIKKTATLR